MENTLLSNRKYRLYAGHGNWINLGVKTTHELLDIFSKGVPTRYQLAPGLFIDIIPHDVDCNSKNIDMLGLMRADLVYESTEENTVQQSMSNYIRSLLDDQGIIDAFPPAKTNDPLPVITSLPSHRHLSLVPSATGIVRRGPKALHDYNYDSSSSNQSKKKACVSKRSHKRAKQSETIKKPLLPLEDSIHLLPHEPSFPQPRLWNHFYRPSELDFEFDASGSSRPQQNADFDRVSSCTNMMIHHPSTTHSLMDYEPEFDSTAQNWEIKEDPWMSSIEYRKVITPPSFDLHRPNVDPGYYFDSSKSTTGPASPSDLNEILPESVKRVLL